MAGNEDLYDYQFGSMLQAAKEILGRPAIRYSDNDDEKELDEQIEASKLLFDVGGADFSKFKTFEKEYRYWVEIYIIKIIEKLMERSGYAFDEQYYGDGNEQYSINYSYNEKRIAAFFLFDLTYLDGDRTDYDKIGKALKEKAGEIDEIRIYVFRNCINAYTLAGLVNGSEEYNENGLVKVMTIRDFFCEMWGEDEYLSFEKYANDYELKVKNIIGYKTVIAPTKQTVRVFKTIKSEMLKQENYKAIADKGELGTISGLDFERIKTNYLQNKMYRVMVSSNDFADSFVSAEWAYDVFSNAMGELELTGIISGYLKSIEQLLYRIARFHRDEGLYIKTKNGNQPYTTTNEEIIDSTLGSLKSFVFSYDAKQAINNKIRKYIKGAVELWTNYQRNGFFHKHNLFGADNKIKLVREQTLYLYFLILGGLNFTPDQLHTLGADLDENKQETGNAVDYNYPDFRAWFNNIVKYDSPMATPGLWMLLLQEDGWLKIQAYFMKYFYIDDFENSQFDYRSKVVDYNHLRSIPVFRWQADNDSLVDGASQLQKMLERYKQEPQSGLDKIETIVLSFGKVTKLIHFQE